MIPFEPYYQDDHCTIYNADCRDVLPYIDRVGVMVTDPPYGIGLKENGRNGYDWNVIGDNDSEIGKQVLDGKFPAIAFASWRHPWPGDWRQWLVWDKGQAVGGGGDKATCWKFDFELIQVRNLGVLNGKRDSSVLRYHVGQQNYSYHPCQKPISLMRYLICKIDAEVILDPFAGSGTTLLAAKLEGRRAIGIEIEERYCESAAKRLSQGVLDLTL